MKLRLLFLLLLGVGAYAQPDPAQDARYVARVLTKLEEGVEKARAHREIPDWYVQCQIDLGELEQAILKLPEPDRVPYLAKINLYRPEIEAGVKLSRGAHLARQIRSILDSAKEDVARVSIDQTIFESVDQHFADPDAKGIPTDQLKVLQADYAELKKASAAKKKQ